ncbi:MAG: hypothetical protein ACJ74J_13340 [Blastocatellia bacterium]
MDDELRELKQRITMLSNEELLRMVGKDRREYRPEAIEFARTELDARRAAEGDETDDAEADEDTFNDNGSPASVVPSVEAQPCNICGGSMRRGALFADREITVYFDDTEEERFVEVMVCGACGNLRMFVDLDTDVQE